MLMSAQPMKRQLDPVTRKFKTDEELLEYYEMKAVDAYDRIEDQEEEGEELFKDISLRQKESINKIKDP